MSRLSQGIRATALGAFALLAAASVARAQMGVHAIVNPAITVTQISALDFGSVTRPSTTDITYSSASTGILQVVGATGATVQVTFPATVVLTGGATPPTYTLLSTSVGTKTIATGTCDRSGVASVDVTAGLFTSSLGSGGILCYTVGGRLVAVVGTTPGTYNGTLTITVIY